MSNLENKSEIFSNAAKLLHEKNYYSAVAHGAYYSCYQLFKHIWLHTMGKTENELENEVKKSKEKSHGYLINKTVSFIANSGRKDCQNHARDIGNKIPQLKKLRVDADYTDDVFDSLKSSKSINLSNDIIPFFKKYC